MELKSVLKQPYIMEIYKGLLSQNVQHTKNEESNYPNMLHFKYLILHKRFLSTINPDGFS